MVVREEKRALRAGGRALGEEELSRRTVIRTCGRSRLSPNLPEPVPVAADSEVEAGDESETRVNTPSQFVISHRPSCGPMKTH